MEKKEWIKQICPDNSIQFLLCDNFIHPTVNECVVVGNSSLRLLVLQSNQISEVTRYDHPNPITSATISYKGDHPDVCFISGQDMYFALPTLAQFKISDEIHLNDTYSVVVSNKSLICLNNLGSTLMFYQRFTQRFVPFELPNSTKVWSCSFMADNLATLEYQNVFRIKVYSTKDVTNIRCVATYSLNYYTPYKLVSIPNQNSIYLLAESTIIQVQQADKGWIFNRFPVDIRFSDQLLVDIAPIGVRLFILSADGLILRFDGQKFELIAEMQGATLLSSLTISRFIVAFESCRLKLYDRDLLPLEDEIIYSNCIHSSYTPGNFIVASQYSINSSFYDYGIEIDKCVQFYTKIRPKLFASKNCLFCIYSNRTIILDNEFRDVTPSAVKKCVFERVHPNSHNSFFGLTSTHITIYEYGSICTFEENSTLSAHRLNTLFIAEKRMLTSFLFCHKTLIKQSTKMFDSQITAISMNDTMCVSLWDGSVRVLDDNFNAVKKVNFDFVIFSIAFREERGFAFGTGSGEIIFADLNLENVIIESEYGNSTVHLSNINNDLSALCDKNFYFLTEKTGRKKLPPDFYFFSAFGDNSSYVALTKSSMLKQKNYNLIQIHFSETSLGFHHKNIFTFNKQITKLSSSANSADFVCCIDRSTLFWSRGEIEYTLKETEEANSITEWEAMHANKLVTFWVICTTINSNEGRLLILLQNRKDNKIVAPLVKVFNSPIVAFAISSPSLAFFIMNDIITGITIQSGSLQPKAKSNARILNVVAVDCTEKLVAVLANQHKFSLFEIVNEDELKAKAVVNKPGIFGRIKIIGNKYIAISSRVNPSLYIYNIQGNVEIVREVMLLSPVRSIFNTHEKMFVNCICGEMFLISCDDQKIKESDTTKLFSFGHSMFSLNE